MAERKCPVCGRRFRPRTVQHRFCTPVCRERAKATMRARKPARYVSQHQRARTVATRLVRAGGARCSRCGLPIRPDEEFDLDHADDGNGYLGVAHVSCNRGAPHTRKTFEDRPGEGVFWGPPSEPGGVLRRWSRLWFEWRGVGDQAVTSSAQSVRQWVP